MAFLDLLADIVGADHVLTGQDTSKYAKDWLGQYPSVPVAVVRPASTEQVSQVVKLANQAKVAIVPMSGNTGLAGGGYAEGALVLSLERMNKIRDIRPESKVAIVEAGVILTALHNKAEEHDMIFPLYFGARGSAMIGGVLATNAGGSNVLRYGNTRDLVLGIEVVLPNGDIMDIMSELHKDNSGYNLKHLLIGAEGTLGIITGAVLKLHPKPKAVATAMLACRSLPDALRVLNSLQQETGNCVEAFEYMPRYYIQSHLEVFPDARAPFDAEYDVNILLEAASTIQAMAESGADGKMRWMTMLEDRLAALMQDGIILDAVVSQNEAQRMEMWARREAAAELSLRRRPLVNNDIALPIDKVAEFLETAQKRVLEICPTATVLEVAHLGDGNVHYVVWPNSEDPSYIDRIMEGVENIVLEFGGSFSAEHGIGRSKLPSMKRRKNPVAIQVMRQIKQALDPNNIMNPGKVLPEIE